MGVDYSTARNSKAKRETQMFINKEMDKIWYPHRMYCCLDKGTRAI